MGLIETRQDLTASIKEQTDIVKIIGEHVELKRSGVRYLGLCPFHGEKTPSFSVHGAQQFFYCFGCGESGDVFSFLMKYQNLDFPAVIKQLADRLNIDLPQKNLSHREREVEKKRRLMYEVTQKAAKIYRQYLVDNEGSRLARQYLLERGITEKEQARFEIGYAPSKEIAGWNFLERQLSEEEVVAAEQVGLLVKGEKGGRYDRFRDRVLFPIHDVQGRVCGFGGRIVGEGQPKYMNSPESHIYNKSNNLLGLYTQNEVIRKRRKAIIVEGNFDMISMVVHGCGNVVAPLGTALTAAQIRLLGRYAQEAILLFDGDDAGRKAALRSAPHFLSERVDAKVAILPKNHDPDTFIREEGLGKLNELLDGAKELSEFVLDELILQHGLSLEGKSRIAEEIKPLIHSAGSQLQRSVIIAHFSEKLGVQVSQLEDSLKQQDDNSRIKHDFKALKQSEKTNKYQLSSAQKRLVEFMIMNPHCLIELEEGGLRKFLKGTIGEIIFLQIKMMITERKEVQPEEVLSALPEGPERKFVADILMEAPQIEFIEEGSQRKKEELGELLEWLDIQVMRNTSSDLTAKIEEAQKNNDFQALEILLHEKQNIEKALRRFRQ